VYFVFVPTLGSSPDGPKLKFHGPKDANPAQNYLRPFFGELGLPEVTLRKKAKERRVDEKKSLKSSLRTLHTALANGAN
jgi:hypothetical protein